MFYFLSLFCSYMVLFSLFLLLRPTARRRTVPSQLGGRRSVPLCSHAWGRQGRDRRAPTDGDGRPYRLRNRPLILRAGPHPAHAPRRRRKKFAGARLTDKRTGTVVRGTKTAKAPTCTQSPSAPLKKNPKAFVSSQTKQALRLS